MIYNQYNSQPNQKKPIEQRGDKFILETDAELLSSFFQKKLSNGGCIGLEFYTEFDACIFLSKMMDFLPSEVLMIGVKEKIYLFSTIHREEGVEYFYGTPTQVVSYVPLLEDYTFLLRQPDIAEFFSLSKGRFGYNKIVLEETGVKNNVKVLDCSKVITWYYTPAGVEKLVSLLRRG